MLHEKMKGEIKLFFAEVFLPIIRVTPLVPVFMQTGQERT
jgi:hypothetical protein